MKIFLKKAEFRGKRPQSLEHHIKYEAELLRMYAGILCEMLVGSSDVRELEGLKDQAELECIIEECHKAKGRIEQKEKESKQARHGSASNLLLF